MSQDLILGMTLLLVGMVTVFVILFLVVSSGNALILFVNKFFPEKKVPTIWERHASETTGISPQILSVILATVEIVTKGQGKVVTIEKTNNGKSN